MRYVCTMCVHAFVCMFVCFLFVFVCILCMWVSAEVCVNTWLCVCARARACLIVHTVLGARVVFVCARARV